MRGRPAAARWLRVTAAAAILLAAGCATTPDYANLGRARAAVAGLAVEQEIHALAPAALADAQAALAYAEAAVAAELPPAEVAHRAELALRAVAITRAVLQRQAAERRADAAKAAVVELGLRKREIEVQAALQAALAAERRARALRAEAAAVRREASTARARLDVTQSRLELLQAQLAELDPRLGQRGLVLTLGEALFEFDSPRLKPYTLRIVDRLAEFLVAHEAYPVAVEGHTDNAGEAQVNRETSQARADAVASALAARGVDTTRITATGYGETRPAASNETAAGRRQNRRVEVILLQAPESG